MNRNVLCVFTWPKGEHVEKCRVFVCFCSIGKGKMSKSVMFLNVFWVESGAGRSKGGNVEKCNVFQCFLGKVRRWAPEMSAQPFI